MSTHDRSKPRAADWQPGRRTTAVRDPFVRSETPPGA